MHVTQEFPRGLWSWFGDTLVAELVEAPKLANLFVFYVFGIIIQENL